MQHVIQHAPFASLLQVQLGPNEVLIAESGSMVARDHELSLEVRMNANPRATVLSKLKAVFVAFLRKMVGGETFFVNHFNSPTGGWVWLAPPLSGDVRHLELDGTSLLLSRGTFLASTDGVDLRMRWGGLKGILSKEGAFCLEASGSGQLWVTSYGAIEEISCDGSYVIDTGHLVAFDSSLTYRVRGASEQLVGLIGSGEGLVMEFTGTGRLFIQSRAAGSVVNWLSPLLPD